MVERIGGEVEIEREISEWRAEFMRDAVDEGDPLGCELELLESEIGATFRLRIPTQRCEN